jgi:hypothetical protein
MDGSPLSTANHTTRRIERTKTRANPALLATSAAALVLISGCSGDSLELNGYEETYDGREEAAASGGEIAEFGTSEQALCSNTGGVNGIMAALAVASANEMRRWLPTRDFQWNASTGQLELSQHAVPRCRPEGTGKESTKDCPNTRALLALQSPLAHGKVTFPDNVKLDSTLLRQTLKKLWDQQVTCINAGNCPVDYHDLKYHHAETGPCGMRYFYDAFEQCVSKDGNLCGPTAPRVPLTAQHAERFANQLLFLGHPSNPFLAFAVKDDRASVDPTYGLTENVSATGGSCRAACTMITTANLTGNCCSCNGKTKRFTRSAFNASTYLCQ